MSREAAHSDFLEQRNFLGDFRSPERRVEALQHYRDNGECQIMSRSDRVPCTALGEADCHNRAESPKTPESDRD